MQFTLILPNKETGLKLLDLMVLLKLYWQKCRVSISYSNILINMSCHKTPVILSSGISETTYWVESSTLSLSITLVAIELLRWVERQTQWWPRHKAIYFSWFGPELFCLLLGPPGFNCWFSSAPVFQWCCSTPQGSPGVGRNTFLSSPHLCFIIVFICDLFVSRDDPLMS